MMHWKQALQRMPHSLVAPHKEGPVDWTNNSKRSTHNISLNVFALVWWLSFSQRWATLISTIFGTFGCGNAAAKPLLLSPARSVRFSMFALTCSNTTEQIVKCYLKISWPYPTPFKHLDALQPDDLRIWFLFTQMGRLLEPADLSSSNRCFPEYASSI